jgi:hypothetical protein
MRDRHGLFCRGVSLSLKCRRQSKQSIYHSDGQLDQLMKTGVKSRTCPCRIRFHGPAIIDHFGSRDRRQPSLDPFFGHDIPQISITGGSLRLSDQGCLSRAEMSDSEGRAEVLSTARLFSD